MSNTAIGFRVHSGWAALVALSMEKGKPAVLVRQRINLVETFSYKFRQPYHTAEKLPLGRAQEFVSSVDRKARRLAYAALQKVQKDLAASGHRLTHCGLLLASGRPLPPIEKILASHALIHTADGELFREVLTYAAARCKLPLIRIREKELIEEAVKHLKIAKDSLSEKIQELGRPLGSPWTQDEKFAALIAWLALRPLSR